MVGKKRAGTQIKDAVESRKRLRATAKKMVFGIKIKTAHLPLPPKFY